MQYLKVIIYHSFTKSKALWIRFARNADYYGFQTYPWLWYWYKIVGFKEGIKPCLVFVFYHHQPIMLLPLGIKRQGWFTKIIWLGGEITDYQGPLLTNKYYQFIKNHSFKLIWNEIKQKLPYSDVIHFTKQPAVINNQPNPFLELNPKIQYRSYYTTLFSNWENFYRQHATKKTREGDKRKQKKLGLMGRLTFNILSDNQQIRKTIKQLITHKQQHLNENKQSNIFNNQYYRNFLLQMALKLTRSGLINITTLELDNKIIATHWGLIFKQRFYWLVTTYDKQYSKFSPGRLLLIELLKWCYQRKIKIFDFTIGDEKYKQNWCDQKINLYEYRESFTLRGKLYSLMIKLLDFGSLNG